MYIFKYLYIDLLIPGILINNLSKNGQDHLALLNKIYIIKFKYKMR